MDYQQWVKLFGRTTDDDSVRATLEKAGVKTPLKIGKNETEVRIDIADTGIILVFTDEAFFNQNNDLAIGKGSLILSGVILIVEHSKASLYKGPLPFELRTNNSREDLRIRFGIPARENERFRWEEWKVGELMLLVVYAKEINTLARVGVRLPGVR